MTVQQVTLLTPSPTIALVPWDPNSVAHVERMTQQRIACGWKAERVPYWQRFQKEGKLALFWVVSIFDISLTRRGNYMNDQYTTGPYTILRRGRYPHPETPDTIPKRD